jgi:hypothetical protein
LQLQADNAAFHHLERDAVLIAQMSKDVQKFAKDQQQGLDDAQMYIESAKARVQAGEKDIKKAEEYQTSCAVQ